MRSLLVLSLFVCCAWAQVAIRIQHLDKGAPQVCKEGGISYDPEDTWMVNGECAQYRCLVHGPSSMAIEITGCGSPEEIGDKYCKLERVKFEKPYPDCCPGIMCI